VGPRQAGKSTLIWKYLADKEEPCLFLNCEEPAIREWLASPAVFLADLEKLTERPVALFFEEIQRLQDAGLFLKGIVDRGYAASVFATGSSSFDLDSRTRESLAGRALRHLVLPFSLSEAAFVIRGPEALYQRRLEERLSNMLLFGGYPTVFLSEDPEKELAVLAESFIVRDASDRFRVRYPAAFRKVLELASSQIGNLCNYSEWASIAGVSNDTVSEYVRLMEETHVVRLVRPFVGGKRAELTSAPKMYLVDNGVRNIVFGGFNPAARRPDRGALWENFAFSETIKSINPMLDTVRYWRSKGGAEVDFVIEHQGRIIACEAKAGDPRGKLTRAARSFIDAYRPEMFLVVGNRAYPDRDMKETSVRFILMPELGRAVKTFTFS
jgi:predicted AAA+ superfamily ATPase